MGALYKVPNGSGQSLATEQFVVHFELKTVLLVIAILHPPLTKLLLYLFFTGCKLCPPSIGIEAWAAPEWGNGAAVFPRALALASLAAPRRNL